jgi:hypothetical protein
MVEQIGIKPVTLRYVGPVLFALGRDPHGVCIAQILAAVCPYFSKFLANVSALFGRRGKNVEPTQPMPITDMVPEYRSLHPNGGDREVLKTNVVFQTNLDTLPRMPTVATINGFRFFFYSEERTEPPHIHVEKGDCETKFWLNPIKKAVKWKFPVKDLKKVREIIKENQAFFIKEYHEHDSKKR